MPRCCRAGAARRRSTAPSRRATTQTGITIMQMDAGLDTGDMLRRRAARDRRRRHHRERCTTGSRRSAARLIVEALERARRRPARRPPQPRGRRHLRAQDRRRPRRRSTGARRRPTIERRLRAFDPVPGRERACWPARRSSCWRGRGRRRAAAQPGEVRRRRRRRHHGRLRPAARCALTELQRPGGQRLAAEALLRGCDAASAPSSTRRQILSATRRRLNFAAPAAIYRG